MQFLKRVSKSAFYHILSLTILLGTANLAGWLESERPSPRRPDPRMFEGPVWDFATREWKDWPVTASENLFPERTPVSRQSRIAVPVEKTPALGTAFSVTGSGQWITARHVVDGCAQVLIQIGPKRGIRVDRVFNHPNADVSLLVTRRGFPPLPLAAQAKAPPINGFHFGFPRGLPGALHAAYLGQARLSTTGRYRISEPVMVWTEESRIPQVFKSLGGMSGGPVLDGRGRVIGVVLAESQRRGRTYSAVPATIRQALDLGKRAVPKEENETGGVPLSSGDYARFGRKAITGLTIARVICKVESKK